MCHQSCVVAWGLYKVVHKIGCLRKFNRAFLTFSPLGLSLWNLVHSGQLSRVQGSQAYIWLQSILFLWQRLFCAAPGRHLCTKFRGRSADHGQLRSAHRQNEDHAHAQRHVLKRLLWLKFNDAQGRRAWLEQQDRRMSEVASTFVQGLPVPFKLDENHFPCVLATRVILIIGHATVFHGDGVEFGACGPPLRRNVCMSVNGGRRGELTKGKFMLISRNRRTEVAVHRVSLLEAGLCCVFFVWSSCQFTFVG